MQILHNGKWKEVMFALQTACALEKRELLQILPVPCFDLLLEQSEDYINKIIDPKTKVYAVEASRGLNTIDLRQRYF